ncbi:hypothetical protein [Nostoc sp. C117]|uniref:hypothetical protein n=1 Tax=Nostoc sp. C117 TaxID=3349875 RepID=UPI00370D94C8
MYPDGLNILHYVNLGNNQREIDAETTHYQYDFNLANIGKPNLEEFAGCVLVYLSFFAL